MLLGQQDGDALLELGHRWADVELTATTENGQDSIDLALVMDCACGRKLHVDPISDLTIYVD